MEVELNREEKKSLLEWEEMGGSSKSFATERLSLSLPVSISGIEVVTRFETWVFFPTSLLKGRLIHVDWKATSWFICRNTKVETHVIAQIFILLFFLIDCICSCSQIIVFCVKHRDELEIIVYENTWEYTMIENKSLI